MTLAAVLRKLWRYKLVTIPIIVLILGAAAYIVAVKKPVYESNVEYLLFAPPSVPQDTTNPQILRAADNPYTRVGDMTVISQLMATRLGSSEARLSLAAKGADPTYIVAPGGGFGYSVPTVLITGTGPTSRSAIRTANLVGAAMTRELDQMQQARGVSATYRITAQAVVPAHEATLRPSGMLRGLFGVVAAGSVLLFFAVSILDAIATLRREGSAGDHDGPHAVPDVPHVVEDIGWQPPPRRHVPAPPAGGARWDAAAVEDLAQAPAGGAPAGRRRRGGRAA